jgi:hypothetical protein
VRGRIRRTTRGVAALDGRAAVGVLILVSLVMVPIIMGFSMLLILVLAPISHGRMLVNDSILASPRKPHKELAFLNPDSTWSISASSTLWLALHVRDVEGSAHTYRRTVTTHAPGRASIMPAPSTVLTFINPTKPGTQQANGTVAFAVKVDNHTGSSQQYQYAAMTQTPGHARVDAATGSFTLANAHYAVASLDVRVVCTGTRSRINVSVGSVSLGGAHQTIGFWLPCQSKRA